MCIIIIIIIIIIISLAVHVARTGEGRCVYRVLVGKPEVKGGHWGDSGVDTRVTLRRIFRKWDVGVWTGLSWLTIGTGGGHLCMR
jgi:hypothetical protein